jgi:hypothetical protein
MDGNAGMVDLPCPGADEAGICFANFPDACNSTSFDKKLFVELVLIDEIFCNARGGSWQRNQTNQLKGSDKTHIWHGVCALLVRSLTLRGYAHGQRPHARPVL